LGCRDPVERIAAAKANDPERQFIHELFDAWWQHHQNRSVTAAGLAAPVQAILNPQGRPRQYIASRLAALAGTRAGGFVLTRQESAGKWTAATYALFQTRGDQSQPAKETDRRRA
jgi:hypothetical protein